jgi:hypothetical protein
MGLEAKPGEYVERMVEVFREVRRVLKPEGQLWLNLGDCYATGAGSVGEHPGGGRQGKVWRGGGQDQEGKPGYISPIGPLTQPNRMPLPGLKAKDLAGIPWRLAFALHRRARDGEPLLRLAQTGVLLAQCLGWWSWKTMTTA